MFVFLWFLIGGIAHFVAVETEARFVPPYMLVARIQAQVALLALIAWSTSPRAARQAGHPNGQRLTSAYGAARKYPPYVRCPTDQFLIAVRM